MASVKTSLESDRSREMIAALFCQSLYAFFCLLGENGVGVGLAQTTKDNSMMAPAYDP